MWKPCKFLVIFYGKCEQLLAKDAKRVSYKNVSDQVLKCYSVSNYNFQVFGNKFFMPGIRLFEKVLIMYVKILKKR